MPENPTPTIPLVTRRAFDGFDEFAESFDGAEILRRARGPCRPERITADLGRLVLIWSFRTPPIIANATIGRGQRTFLIRMGGAGRVLINGHALDDRRLLDHRPGTEMRAAKTGEDVQLARLVVRPEELDRVSLALTGERFSSGPSLCTLLEPDPAALERLRRLCATALIAIEHPASVASAHFFTGFAEAVLRALVAAVQSDPRRKEGRDWAGDFQTRIIQRADGFLRGHPGQPVPVPVLCGVAEVNERQLQRAFRAVYAIGPSGYCRLRRLHLARAALRNAPPGATVAQAATRIGFSDLGRFASAYFALFGETPSATLQDRSRRPPPRLSPAAS